MFKKKMVLFFCLMIAVSFLHLQASEKLNIKLRVYEGAKEGTAEPLRFVTSSFLQSTVSATIQTEFKLEEEREKIQRVFNLQDVSLLTETELELGLKPDQVSHYFRLNGKEYYIIIALSEWKGMGQFVIAVNEVLEDKKKNILTTAITLPGGNAAVFGFEDREGKPYFLSFHVTSVIGPDGKLKPPPPPPPPPPPKKGALPSPPPPPTEEELKEFAEGAVVAVGEIKPPRIIKEVPPVYPEIARQALVRGTVLLGVRVDIHGRVTEVMVLKSIPLLNKAAVDAVKQWVYEPFIWEGKLTPVVFSVNVVFKVK
ncbi:MAG: energy transducer TonB [Candidatus Aminicenantes bacterium]|nr:energy transducer TonB [Candidatus Aminicenantes bacterium]MDH5705742.1 energy transducer TonB [Candidatus Aminicenantes bacterium]